MSRFPCRRRNEQFDSSREFAGIRASLSRQLVRLFFGLVMNLISQAAELCGGIGRGRGGFPACAIEAWPGVKPLDLGPAPRGDTKAPLVYLGRFERLRPNQLNLAGLTLSSKVFIPAF